MEHDEKLVKKVADAIYGAAVKQALQMAADVPTNHDKIQRVLSETKTNTDRAAAILVFALIDDLFIFYFSLFLNKEINGGIKSLFEANGMLSTSHNRITFAASLYWIGKTTYKDLRILKKIRNEFAHKTEIHTFSEQSIHTLVHSLESYENLIIKNKDLTGSLKKTNEFSPRELFLMRSGLLINNLVRELIICRSALTHKVAIKDVMDINWDDAPDNIKMTSRGIARFVSGVMEGKSA